MFTYPPVSIQTLNAYDIEFARFFTRNIVQHGKRTLKAFDMAFIKNSCSDLRTANITQFSAYVNSKLSKRGKCPQLDGYLKEMANGNAIAALKCLAQD